MDLKWILSIQNQTGFIGTDYIYKYPITAITFLVMLTLSTTIGGIGNILTIIAITTIKELNTTGNMFVVNLAITDLAVSLFVNLFNIAGVIIGEMFFRVNRWLCELVGALCLTVCICSLLSITSVGFNRYIFIVHNSLYHKVYTRRNTVLFCIGLWIIAFIAQMGNEIGWGDNAFDRKTLSCIYSRTAARSFTNFFAGFLVMAPIIFTAVCYILIFYHWKKSANRVKEMKGENSKKQNSEANNSMRLARMLFVIYFTFVMCWFPYAVIVLIDFHDSFPAEVHGTLIITAHLNSSLNAILYGFTNIQFRRAYYKLLGLQRFIEKQHPGTISVAI
uniref:GCR029 n=1 Tax=Schmidtea mediterranea TaxID=79327 RepID=A0A193KUF6_SCHMD|nr:GCR029 [Schmidtea mediterranea]